MNSMYTLIKKLGGEKYPIYAKNMSIDPKTGADIVKYIPNGEIFALFESSQGDSSATIVDKTGASFVAEFFMFHIEDLELNSRVEYKNQLYEIMTKSPWQNGFLCFFKSYLVKIDKGVI